MMSVGELYRMNPGPFLVFGGVILLMGTALVALSAGYRRIEKLRRSLAQTGEELKEAKSRAEDSERQKTAFLQNMSHELRTPLNALIGFSTLLCEDGLSREERSEYADRIRRNGALLQKMIGDMLDLARFEAGMVSLNLVRTDVVALAALVLESVSPEERRPGVALVFRPAVPSCMAVTDSLRLSQVLNNLLSNALKYTESGEVVLEVVPDRKASLVRFAVTDTGCGISPGMEEKVFVRFHKSDENKQGFGLGLPICRQISYLLGGRVYVDPACRRGARLVFEHPWTESESGSADLRARSKP